jgi:hypothetical protein
VALRRILVVLLEVPHRRRVRRIRRRLAVARSEEEAVITKEVTDIFATY